MPLDATDAPPPLPEIAQLYPLQRRRGRSAAAARARRRRPDRRRAPPTTGWSSGARTHSGKPLLANDPHLRLAAPAIWYLAHLALERPGGRSANVVGATLAGVPLIVLGRSDTLAWGFTNTGADVQDLFIEKINPDNPREYLTPEGWRPFESEQMTIAVKGVGVRTVERRRTRHGPVLPGFYRNLEGAARAGPRGGPAVDRLERRRHDHCRRHARPERAHASPTTWSACASTSCRCRAWWWPIRPARSA